MSREEAAANILREHATDIHDCCAQDALDAADGVMFSDERVALLTIELEHFRTSEEPTRVFAHRIIASLREGA